MVPSFSWEVSLGTVVTVVTLVATIFRVGFRLSRTLYATTEQMKERFIRVERKLNFLFGQYMKSNPNISAADIKEFFNGDHNKEPK